MFPAGQSTSVEKCLVLGGDVGFDDRLLRRIPAVVRCRVRPWKYAVRQDLENRTRAIQAGPLSVS